MEKLVHVPPGDAYGDVLRRARERGADGVELDVTGFADDRFEAVRDAAANEGVAVRSLHDDRARSISIAEEDLFLAHVEELLDWAEDLGAEHISVHPPRVEVGESHTVRDVERFLSTVNGAVDGRRAGFGFAVDGFLREPELINTAFRAADTGAIEVAVDLSRFVDGIDPAAIVERLAVPVQKMRVPVPFHQLEAVVGDAEGMHVVAERV